MWRHQKSRSICVKQALNTRRWLVNALVTWHVSYKITTNIGMIYQKNDDFQSNSGFCQMHKKSWMVSNLGAHIERVHSKKYNSMGKDYVDSIKCSSCGKTFSSGNLYIQHYQSKHGDFPPEYNDREKFICDQCPKVFLEKHRLAYPRSWITFAI